MIKIDAVGKACPIPVIMAKKEIDNKVQKFIIVVDNQIAVENLKKLANTTGYQIDYKKKDDSYVVGFSLECDACNRMLEEAMNENTIDNVNHMVFVGKEYLGEGDLELGKNLIRMFFYTLVESKNTPKHIIFINGGVKLPTLDEQIIEHLKALEAKGTTILSCGACLNYYKLADQLQVGEVTNMYTIVELMEKADKIIQL